MPEDLFLYDMSNTVHVLDLAIVLPLLAATGVLLFRGHPVADVLAAVRLVKALTLGLVRLSMNAFVAASGGTVAPGEPVTWSVVVAVAVAWCALIVRRARAPDGPWLRGSVWC